MPSENNSPMFELESWVDFDFRFNGMNPLSIVASFMRSVAEL